MTFSPSAVSVDFNRMRAPHSKSASAGSSDGLSATVTSAFGHGSLAHLPGKSAAAPLPRRPRRRPIRRTGSRHDRCCPDPTSRRSARRRTTCCRPLRRCRRRGEACRCWHSPAWIATGASTTTDAAATSRASATRRPRESIQLCDAGSWLPHQNAAVSHAGPTTTVKAMPFDAATSEMAVAVPELPTPATLSPTAAAMRPEPVFTDWTRPVTSGRERPAGGRRGLVRPEAHHRRTAGRHAYRRCSQACRRRRRDDRRPDHRRDRRT